MRYFKHNNEIYAYDEEQIAKGLAKGEEISRDELERLLNPPLSEEERLKALSARFIARVDGIMNDEAHKHGYDDIKTAVSYAAMKNRFYEEGKAFFKWRSDVYDWGYSLVDKFKNGEFTLESFNLDEILKDMPKLKLSKSEE